MIRHARGEEVVPGRDIGEGESSLCVRKRASQAIQGCGSGCGGQPQAPSAGRPTRLPSLEPKHRTRGRRPVLHRRHAGHADGPSRGRRGRGRAASATGHERGGEESRGQHSPRNSAGETWRAPGRSSSRAPVTRSVRSRRLRIPPTRPAAASACSLAHAIDGATPLGQDCGSKRWNDPLGCDQR